MILLIRIYLFAIIVGTIDLPYSEAQTDSCFVFKNGSYTGSQIAKNQYFSIVASEASSSSCSFGSVVGSMEGRLYVKNPETGQVNRLGGEMLSEFEAQALASQNNIAFYNCTKIVCSQNSMNTSPGYIEPEEQIAQVASQAGKSIAQRALDNDLKNYLITLSYAHQVKYLLKGLSESTLRDQAVSGSTFKNGYQSGLSDCEKNCVQDGENRAAKSADFQAQFNVGKIINIAFESSEKPIFSATPIPVQDEKLASLKASKKYAEDLNSYWNEVNYIYIQNISTVSSCSSIVCRIYGNFSIYNNLEITSLPSLLGSHRNLLDYNDVVDTDQVFSFFENKYGHQEITAYKYLEKISNSSLYQNTINNKETFKKYFIAAAVETFKSQWPAEINKYTTYYPVQGHVTDIIRKITDLLGYAIGYNIGYAENFLIPAQSGYKKTFDNYYVSSYNKRVEYFKNNALFTDVKVTISNPAGSKEFGPYDELLLTLDGVSNKGFQDGELNCELRTNSDAIDIAPKKSFKIPAFTKSDKKVPLGVLGTLNGQKITPSKVLNFNVICGHSQSNGNDLNLYYEATVTWSETIKRLAQENNPEKSKIYSKYISYYLSTYFNEKVNNNWLSPSKFDTFAAEFVKTYKSLNNVERARLDAEKQTIINSFGIEPKKKLFNKNIKYKIFQIMKGHFSQIGWTSLPKK